VVATLPLFPLGTVLLPGASLPLHIFEPRYRQLVVDLVTGAVPDKQFGVVAVREGWAPDDDGLAGLHPVGCTAELLDVRRLPDGRFDVVTRGARRFRLLEIDDESKPYLLGSVDYLPDDVAPTDAAPGEAGDPDLTRMLAADCLLPISDRQRLLEQTCPTARLRLVRELLARETGLLTQLHAVPAPITTYAVEHSHN
jgi:uncharacterized protein